MGSNEAATREAAYYKWCDAGQPLGEDLRFWLEAEQDQDAGEMAGDEEIDESSRQSFPASDPPSGSITKVGSTPRPAMSSASSAKKSKSNS